MTGTLADTAPLHDALRRRLTPEAAAWFDSALHEVATAPGTEAATRLPVWERHFATAGRRCRTSATGAAGDCADVVRVLLLQAAGVGVDELARVYVRGSAEERRAVLLALPFLPGLGAGAVPLVEDALRANDTRLVAAAVGPYAAAHLDGHGWRQAVLKCLFTGVPLAAVASLAERGRGDGELARMLTDYAAERTAAGRPVPGDLHRAVALTQEIS